MTVQSKRGVCESSEFILRDGDQELWNSRFSKKNKFWMKPGEYEITMTLVSKEQQTVVASSVNPHCPKDMGGICYDFGLYRACFCEW